MVNYSRAGTNDFLYRLQVIGCAIHTLIERNKIIITAGRKPPYIAEKKTTIKNRNKHTKQYRKHVITLSIL